MSADDDLAALIRAEVARQLAAQQTQIMVVQSVREDGLVNLSWGMRSFPVSPRTPPTPHAGPGMW